MNQLVFCWWVLFFSFCVKELWLWQELRILQECIWWVLEVTIYILNLKLFMQFWGWAEAERLGNDALRVGREGHTAAGGWLVALGSCTVWFAALGDSIKPTSGVRFFLFLPESGLVCFWILGIWVIQYKTLRNQCDLALHLKWFFPPKGIHVFFSV